MTASGRRLRAARGSAGRSRRSRRPRSRADHARSASAPPLPRGVPRERVAEAVQRGARRGAQREYAEYAPGRGRANALAAIGFAIAGFVVGLTFTQQGGPAVDLFYHWTVLPLLAATLVGLVGARAGGGRRAGH